MKIRNEVDYEQRMNFSVRGDRALVIGIKLCVPANEELKREIFYEAHNYAFVMHSD